MRFTKILCVFTVFAVLLSMVQPAHAAESNLKYIGVALVGGCLAYATYVGESTETRELFGKVGEERSTLETPMVVRMSNRHQ